MKRIAVLILAGGMLASPAGAQHVNTDDPVAKQYEARACELAQKVVAEGPQYVPEWREAVTDLKARVRSLMPAEERQAHEKLDAQMAASGGTLEQMDAEEAFRTAELWAERCVMTPEEADAARDSFLAEVDSGIARTDSLLAAVEAQQDVRDAIKANCQAEWGTDYRMVEHCIEQQVEAATALSRIQKSIEGDRDREEILNRCAAESPVGETYDWRMVKHSYDRQEEAYRRVGGR